MDPDQYYLSPEDQVFRINPCDELAMGMALHTKKLTGEGKIFLLVDNWDQDFLMVSYLSRGMGSNDVGLDRGMIGGQKMVYFKVNSLLLVATELPSGKFGLNFYRCFQLLCIFPVHGRHRVHPLFLLLTFYTFC